MDSGEMSHKICRCVSGEGVGADLSILFFLGVSRDSRGFDEKDVR